MTTATPATPAANTATTTNVLSDADQIDRFQGFATKDGEVQKPTAAPAAKATPAPKVAAAAPVEDDEEHGGETDATAAERHKSAQARINKAVGRQRAAERERDALRAQLNAQTGRLDALEARLNAGTAPAAGTGAAKPKTDPNAPNPADYELGDIDGKYLKDLARYEAQKVIEERETQRGKQQQTQQLTAEQLAFKNKVDKFIDSGLEKYEDFDVLVRDDSVHISPVLGELIMESEHGVDIAYALASDPKESKRVSAMSPGRQAAWFGRKEAEFTSDDPDADAAGSEEEPESGMQPRQVKVSKAPTPPTARARGTAGSQVVSADTTDFAAFERMATANGK